MITILSPRSISYHCIRISHQGVHGDSILSHGVLRGLRGAFYVHLLLHGGCLYLCVCALRLYLLPSPATLLNTNLERLVSLEMTLVCPSHSFNM